MKRQALMSDFNTMKRKYGKAAEVKYMLTHPEYRQRFALDQQIKRRRETMISHLEMICRRSISLLALCRSC